jgi:predicted metal-binding membrane protein
MTKFKILGQEPAFYVSVVEAVLAMLLTFGMLDQQTDAVLVATVAAALGFVTAYATHTKMLSSLIGLAKAILVLAVTLGLPLSDEMTGSIMALVLLVAGAYLRDRTAAKDTKISAASPGSLNYELSSLR